jgi:hypothetical protein
VWVFLAWLVFVVTLAVGVAGFIGGVFSAVTDAAPTKSFASGEVATVSLDPRDKPALYASASQPVNFTCQAADGAGKPVTLTKSPVNQTVTDGKRSWELVFDIGAPSPGDYRLRCEAPQGSDVVFGAGKALTGAAGKLVGSAVLLIVVPLVGFLFALITTIVVLVRRGRSKTRQTQWQPYGPPAR